MVSGPPSHLCIDYRTPLISVPVYRWSLVRPVTCTRSLETSTMRTTWARPPHSWTHSLTTPPTQTRPCPASADTASRWGPPPASPVSSICTANQSARRRWVSHDFVYVLRYNRHSYKRDNSFSLGIPILYSEDGRSLNPS